MSFIQRLFMRLLPRRWAEQMKADSQAWRIRCTGCNRSRSIWEIGGIRWKAYSRGKRTIVRCSQCGGMQIAAIEKTPAESSE
jgi:hypothetical protein